MTDSQNTLAKEQDDRQKGCRSERTGSRRRKEREREEEGVKDGLETRMEICKLDLESASGKQTMDGGRANVGGLRVEKQLLKDGG